MGYMHTRYSDDLKIYCDNKDEAIKILEKLSSLYQKKGLYLNKQKTEILTSNEAIQKFVDPRKEIKQINPKIVDKIRHERKERREKIEAKKRDSREIGDGSSDIPYTDGGEIGELDLDIEEETTLLETVFEKRIINSDEDNKSLFKYLVRNLGDLDSEFAVPYCINRIRNGKTQIRHIVDKYFSKLSNKEEIADKLLDYVLKDELHYEFQKFIIVRWFFESKINTEKIRYGMRELLETPHEINEIENYIIAYFGNHGNKTDIEILSEKYTTATSNVQKSVILFAIRKMDPELRGRIYNRAENDHPYCKFSVALGKQSTD